jgi:hypothetical protein
MTRYPPEAPGVGLGVAKLQLQRHELTKTPTDLVWFTDSSAAGELQVNDDSYAENLLTT